MKKAESGVKKVEESFISCSDRTFGRPYCFLPYPHSSFSSSFSTSIFYHHRSTTFSLRLEHRARVRGEERKRIERGSKG